MSPALKLTLFHLFCDTPWYFLPIFALRDYLRIKRWRFFLLVIGLALFRAVLTYLPPLFFETWPVDNIAVNITYYLILVGLVFYTFNLEIMSLVYVFLLTYSFATFLNYIGGLVLSIFYTNLDRSTTVVYTVVVFVLIVLCFPFLAHFYKATVSDAIFKVPPGEFKMLCVSPALFLFIAELYIYISQAYAVPRFSPVTLLLLIIGLLGCFVNLRMVMDSAKRSKQLQEINTELEKKVQERTQEYQQQVILAETANKAKTSFLAMMSHEIRTPLNAIIGLSQIRLQDNLPTDVYADIEKIYGAGTSLLGIINEILDISKIESGSFSLAPAEYSLPSLIHDTAEMNRVRIKGKPIAFSLSVSEDIPERLFGDAQRIRQVLNNLLSNAFKYTKAGSVRLSIDGEKEDGIVRMRFSVRDTGIGIREEDIEKLFLEYSQVDVKANRKIEGTGLGLAITKKLLEMMDGSISVESQYGVGSIFTAVFPQKIADSHPIGRETAQRLMAFSFSDEVQRPKKEKPPLYMPGGRVMVVDDMKINLEVAKGLMQPYGLTVDGLLSGREAIEAVRNPTVRYDLVFMDHMMPEMDGMEATRLIRSINTDYARKIPIVALSANVMSDYLSAGFNDFLAKPINVELMEKILTRYIPQSEASPPPLKESDSWTLARPEGLDIDSGLTRYRGADGYMQILQSYAEHTPELLESLANVTEETLPEYAVTVHGLKGSSYGICAEGIAKQAGALEKYAKAGDYDTVKRDTPPFIVSVRQLLDALAILLPREDESEKEIRLKPDEKLLKRLKNACEDFHISEMKTIAEELKRYRYQQDAELVTWLLEQVDRLEYDAIADRLKEIIR